MTLMDKTSESLQQHLKLNVDAVDALTTFSHVLAIVRQCSQSRHFANWKGRETRAKKKKRKRKRLDWNSKDKRKEEKAKGKSFAVTKQDGEDLNNAIEHLSFRRTAWLAVLARLLRAYGRVLLV